MKTLLTGNSAVAVGSYESVIFAATGYPGTFAPEIIETHVFQYIE